MEFDYNYSPRKKTELLYGVEAAVGRGVQFMKNVKIGMDLFGEKNGPSIIMEFDVYKNNYVDVLKRGGKIRFITEITKENLHYCLELRKIVTEIRHLEGLIGGIAVSESEYMSTTTLREKELLAQVFYSNAHEVVEQGQYIFDTFWQKAIPMEDRVREIKEGIKPEFIETIRDPTRVQNIALDLVRACKEEILTIFSTANAFFRQQRAGGIALLNDVATHGEVNIRILVPYDRRISEFISSLNANNNSIEKKSRTKKINVRYLEPVLNTKMSILIVDRKSSLAVELKDDTKDNIQQAIGLSSYSNSKSTVLSYVSIFETLWKQTEMYQQLKVHDKMQKEFVDIAAHELRTPIQPILGLSEVVRSKLKGEDKELIQLLDVIKRNAQRLQRLTEDILDVSRIESQTLKMHKEKVNIGDRLLYVIGDTKKDIPDPYKLKIFLTEPVGSYYVEADMGRLTQVVSNLLSNAVKFTDKGGEISVHVEKDDTNQQIIVSVKDNGQGIDPEIFPRLFSKFTSKSHVGTGLGLFISKKIIEAHGGRIWAQNNSGGKGSTFSFTLPMSQ